LFVQPSSAENHVGEILETIQRDLKTLEKAVYSDANSSDSTNSTTIKFDQNSEDVLTRHLLKLSGIESQFQDLTNKFEEINFKLDKLSNRLSKTQSDNQMRFQQIEENSVIASETKKLVSFNKKDKLLPGSSKPQDLGSVSYKETETENTTQQTQSIDTASAIVTEIFNSEEKILPEIKPEKQYEFATSFLKVGDYTTAEKAFREIVLANSEHKLAGNAQYWYAETFRIRQLYTDAASAYLEGYQKYPKSDKAPINLLKLGVSLVQIGEKDQGCLMIVGVKKQYPKAKKSVLQKAKYEEKKFECKKENS
jgi:tol-pal system protein YbgF